MNQYDLWRFFGSLPFSKRTLFKENIEQTFSSLKRELEKSPGQPGNATQFANFAIRFSRYDTLIALDDKLGFAPMAETTLVRGRSRFYRALAENPTSPDIPLLNEAHTEFGLAAKYPESRAEARAGLARIHILRGEKWLARILLFALSVFGGKRGRAAAAGVHLFLAESPGTPESRTRQQRKHALRLLNSVPDSDDADLAAAAVEFRLGANRSAFKRLRNLENQGIHEALIMRIRFLVGEQRMSDDSQLDFVSKVGILLEKYRNSCPNDPMLLVARGDLDYPLDPEGAHMSWRAALLLDNRCASAWLRLGDIYQEAYQQAEEEPLDEWLEAARDAYTKAAALNPLNAAPRIALGIVEREKGNNLEAVNALQSALSLVPENLNARRALALCWAKLSTSGQLNNEAREDAINRCIGEWRVCRHIGYNQLYDMSGLLQALYLKKNITESDSEADLLLKHILAAISDMEDALDSLSLIDQLLAAGAMRAASVLLSRCERFIPDHPEILAFKAALNEHTNPREAVNLYLQAASKNEQSNMNSLELIRRAARIASSAGMNRKSEELLENALKENPSDNALLEDLSSKMARENRVEEALQLYRTAIQNNPGNRSIVEDAAWFAGTLEKYDVAETILKDALNSDTGNAELWNQLGVHYMESGSLENAIETYRKAREISPGNPVYRANLGDALRQAREWSEAQDLLEDADDPFSLNALARLQDERSYAFEGSEASANDWDGAGSNYRAAAEADPSNPEYHHDYAWWLYRERRHLEAIEAYRRAATIDPTESIHFFGEAVCYRELGNHEAALTAINRALELSPDDVMIISEKADILGDAGHTSEAEELFFHVINLAEGESWAWEHLAVFREHCADNARDTAIDNESLEDETRWRRAALLAWKQALKINPDSSNLQARTGAAWLLAGRRDKAAEYLESSLKNTSGDAYVLNRLGRLEMEQSDYLLRKGKPLEAETASIKARDYFNLAVENNPAAAELHADLAAWYYRKENWTESLKYYREALECAGHHTDYAAPAGIAAYKTGRYDEAVHLLRIAVESQNTNAEWQNYLGLSLMATGRQDSALEAFRSACLADPDNQEYPANLVMVHETLHHPHSNGPLQ